jgi:hypothetical protein
MLLPWRAMALLGELWEHSMGPCAGAGPVEEDGYWTATDHYRGAARYAPRLQAAV